ncbi:MAG: ABC transporter ATP-binding protein [Desulfurococcales archaeon]|nr:ABC transporter ATP-binding protein [Desulfurococcales archaeon]
MEKIVVVSEVWKRFGKVQALQGVSLEVNKGAIVGLLGPNGAGKTTLLRIILGLMRRDRGLVELQGRDPYRDPRSRHGVGVVFERPVLPESLPVKELLMAAARIHGTSKDQVDEAIAESGLEGHEWKPFNALSAGLKQRAAIAHALVSDPVLLIADEPTSNLDPLERAKILNLLVELNARRGLTVLVSSHVVSEVLRVSQELVIMSRGRVRLRGPPEEVLGGLNIVRVRTSDPESLWKLLSSAGFEARVSGLNVELDVDGAHGKLFKVLSAAASQGLTIYSVDFVEAGLENVIGGEDA